MGNCCTERKKVEEKIDIEKEEEGINKIEAFQPQTNNSSISLPTPISPHGSSLGIITTLTSKKKINDSNQDDENELLPQTNEQKNLQSNTSSTKNTSKEKEKSSIQLLLNNKEIKHYPTFDNASIEIEIQSLNIQYNALYKFGIYFSPFIEISINDTIFYTVNPIDSIIKEENDNSISDANVSGLSQISSNVSEMNISQNSTCSTKSKKTKKYMFDFKGNIPISDDTYFSYLEIKVKNKLIKYENINKNSNNLSKPNEVIIGTFSIQLCKWINSDENENTFNLYSLSESSVGTIDISTTFNINQNENINVFSSSIDYLNKNEYESLLFGSNNDLSYQTLAYNENHLPHISTLKNDLENSISSDSLIQLYQIIVLLFELSLHSFDYITLLFEQYQNEEELLYLFIAIIQKSNQSICLMYTLSSFIANLIKQKFKHYNLSSKSLLIISLNMIKSIYNNQSITLKDYKVKQTLLNCLVILNDILSPPLKESNEAESDYSLRKAISYKEIIIPSAKEITLNENRVKLIKISNKLFDDSEIVCLITKIMRKSLLALFNDKYISKNGREEFHEISLELKTSLLNEKPYIQYLSVLLNQYQHYPELILNVLAITYNITFINSKEKSEALLSFSKEFGLIVFKESFNIYRGRLKGDYKQINKFHIGILSNIYEYSASNNDDLISGIFDDVISFFVVNQSYNKRYEDFALKKEKLFDIHENLIRITTKIILSSINPNKRIHNLIEDKNNHFLENCFEFIFHLKEHQGHNKNNCDIISNILYWSVKLVKCILENCNQNDIDILNELLVDKFSSNFEGLIQELSRNKEEIEKKVGKKGSRMNSISLIIQEIEAIINDGEENEESRET